MEDIGLFLLFMLPATAFLGANDVMVKKILSYKIDEHLLLGIGWTTVGIIVTLVAVLLGLPEIKDGFWIAITSTLIINIFSQWFFYRAFRLEDASIVSPIRLISPPLTVVTGLVILGETANAWGVVGILITIVGLYILLERDGLFGLSPRELLLRPGILFAVAGAVGFALALPFDKKAVVASSALVFVGLMGLGIGLGSLALGWALARDKKEFFRVPKEVWRILPLYLPSTLFSTILSAHALNFAPIAYAASVKRLWSFWAVLFSGAFLKEKDIGRKLFATIIMLGGVAITLIFG